MTDFASLAMRIDSSEVKTGVTALDELTQAGKRAEQANGGFARSGQQVVASAGAQRAGMQQLSFQIGDVAQQFALGTNPMIIFAGRTGNPGTEPDERFGRRVDWIPRRAVGRGDRGRSHHRRHVCQQVA
jgi:hypothetical protein